jgi:hypothetical protein
MRKAPTLLFTMPQVSARDQPEETLYIVPAGVEIVPNAKGGSSFFTNFRVCKVCIRSSQ